MSAAALLALAACGRDRPASGAGSGSGAGDVGGTLVIATAGDADILLPPLVASLQAAQITSQLFDRLAEIDSTMNTVGDAAFAPRLAKSWTWSGDSLSVRFALDPRARWHDGTPVRAADVKFSYEVYADPATGSPATELLQNVASVDAPDSLTAVVHFKSRRPEQFFDFVYNVYVLPQHLLGGTPHAALRTTPFARQPVGTGRFRFVRWEPNQRIEIVADTTNWRGRPKLDRVIWSFAPDPAAATAKLLSGEADLWEMLRGDAIGQVASKASLRAMPYASLDVGFLLFNVRGGMFADRALRRALAESIDREGLVRSALDTLAYVATGPAPRALDGKPHGAITHDLAAAARTLDSLGWRMGPDSVRAKSGKPLAFGLMVPTTSQVRIRLAVLLQEQLKQIGAKVTIEQLEPNAMMQRLGTHKFDAMLHAWHADPSPSTVRQSWGSAAANAPGSPNVAGYASRAFDALIDSAALAFDPAQQKQLYARAYDTLTDDAPAVWIYELRNFAGVHRRVRPAGVRADAWWAALGDWSIPAGERIARDKIGLRTASAR
ncbi:ABC-type transporter, periplasmic subunit [Gemmatirosa kalamazoonensis]|uniref:ABC-type transporter, periplasmic subunit n=2 Tax=Gemmatirosa kalamazoonensis TaxID=861299 RepID=W0RP74_9BACT|nr:ABC-type transporter, periplasmic subunit [Gemmatirosa kalamazoonensis]